VLLSGGGYRAAVTHTGVLAALDDQCVPVDLLSSVSGGSIIAASYALGVPPREFANDLIRQKPGLPDTLLSIFNVFKSPSELYGEHFKDQYFGDRTLDKLPDSPTLLVNVTNLYTTPNVAREIVFKDPSNRDLQRKVRIADAVAASGAFPGAFQPVTLKWQTIDADGRKIDDHRLVDGGVVENLGIEGLRQYYQRMSWLDWYRGRPHILVISDVSGYAGTGERMVINPAADEALLRASDIQFDMLHRLLYRELTGKDDLSSQIADAEVWRQYYPVDFPARLVPESPKPGTRIKVATENGFGEVTVAPPKLATVVIPSTAEGIRKLLEKYPSCVGPNGEPAADVQTRVSALSTLYELNPAQVREAYWLGYALGQLYGQAIECARRELGGHSCEAAPPVPSLTCKAM
jgi:predicted acylesterase/phospholipase RssA